MVLLIIDMQMGSFTPQTPRFDADGVVRRINRLSHAIRQAAGTVIFIQHDGLPGETFEPGSPGWQILPNLEKEVCDLVVRKYACDAFYETDLLRHLTDSKTETLLISGCATDFCIDTTVRSAASKYFNVVVMADCHTTADRPHLDAETVIKHHNWVWENLIVPGRQVNVIPSETFISTIKTYR